MESQVPYSDFQKLDIRVGLVKKVENHPNADKLYVLRVSFGDLGERTIVAGLKEHYEKQDLEGKKGVFIVNLEPAVLRGVKSEGMTLAASSEEKVGILLVDKDIEEGAKVK